jgi:hypothetical protein
MKKLITIILILAMLLPAAAGAVTGESPYYGHWIGRKHGSTANYDEILYYLEITKYTTSEYFVFYLHMGGGFGQGKISDQEIFSDHWEIVDDHLRIPTSGISYIEVYYDKDEDVLFMKDWPNITFIRIP